MAMWKQISWMLFAYRKQLLAVAIPILLLPLPILVSNEKADCGYVLLLMVLFWVLQVIPLPVTGAIPFFLFPMLGILTTTEIAQSYFRDFTMTNMGSFIVAIGMEMSGLHRRLALRTMMLTGSKQYSLMLGMMIPTFVLSMWISNMAVCVMMMSIVEEIVTQLKQQALISSQTVNDNGLSPSGKQSWTADSGNVIGLGYRNAAVSMEESTQEIPNEPSGKTASKESKDPEANTYSGEPEDQVDLDPDVCSLESGPGQPHDRQSLDRWFDNQKTCYVLAIIYTAKVGGAANITGSNANLVIKDLTDQIWQENGLVSSPLNFTSWLVFSLPAQLIAFFVIWAWFCLFYMTCGGCTTRKEDKKYGHVDDSLIKEFLIKEYKSLGKMRYQEYMVTFIMISLILLWFFLEPDFMPGWASKFPPGYIGMSVPGSMVLVAMFVIPRHISCKPSEGSQSVSPLGDFKRFMEVYPWGVMLMTGGGNALSQGMEVTGLTGWLSEGLVRMNDLPHLPLMLVLCLLVTTFTEVIANVVAVQIFTPVASYLALDLGKNPLYLILPVALTCSYSFILPTAGGVNAWVITSGHATVADTLRVGVVTNLLCVLVTILSVQTWGTAYFDLDTIPWDTHNASLVQNLTTPAFSR